MPKIKDILQKKSQSETWSTGPSQSVFQAIELMAFKEIGALTVINDQGHLVGIVSERDYARKVILLGKSSKQIPVSEIMTKEVITVGPDSGIEECMTLMTERRFRHLPVLLESELVGMISVGDLVKAIISEQDFKIEQLERYVRGG